MEILLICGFFYLVGFVVTGFVFGIRAEMKIKDDSIAGKIFFWPIYLIRWFAREFFKALGLKSSRKKEG